MHADILVSIIVTARPGTADGTRNDVQGLRNERSQKWMIARRHSTVLNDVTNTTPFAESSSANKGNNPNEASLPYSRHCHHFASKQETGLIRSLDPEDGLRRVMEVKPSNSTNVAMTTMTANREGRREGLKAWARSWGGRAPPDSRLDG